MKKDNSGINPSLCSKNYFWNSFCIYQRERNIMEKEIRNKKQMAYVYKLLRKEVTPIEKVKLISEIKEIKITKTKYGEIKITHPDTQIAYSLREDLYTRTWTVFKTSPLPDGIGRRYDIVRGGSVLKLEDAQKLATEQLLIEVASAKECEKTISKFHTKALKSSRF